jgi:hypothetical protein
VQLRRWATAHGSGPFAETVAPLADSLCDLVHGDAERASEGLLDLRGVERLGGSAAQREVVEDTLLYCAVQAGRSALAVKILDRRLERRESPRERGLRDRLHVDPASARPAR